MKFKVLFAIFFFTSLYAVNLSGEGRGGKTADILFTHDVHSQLDSAARAATLIKNERRKNPYVFLFDAGDFSMGTLYQMLYKTEAAELRILGRIGTDVTTLGNHEFDFGSDGLHDMLEAAVLSGERLPRIVLSNADWDTSKPGAAAVKQALADYGAAPYTVVRKGDVSIAVFGIFGKDALFCAPTCEVAFADRVESAGKVVADIKAKENVDMIVCVSHSGTNARKSKSEDEILAEKVPGIDVIISGHSHTTLAVPIVHGHTYIVSCGAYSENVGHIELVQGPAGRWNLARYGLIPVTENTAEDPEVRAELDTFNADINSNCLSRYGLHGDEVVAQNGHSLSEADTGYVAADCMRSAVGQLEIHSDNDMFTGCGNPVDCACVPSGLLRGTYPAGSLTVKDVFRSFSLGIGPDGLAGYPLVSIWITGKDMKSVAELDASLSPLMNTVHLYISGFAFTYNPYRLLFNKVEDAVIIGPGGTATPVDENRLYRCIIDIYTARMLNGVIGITKGMVSIVPRDAEGNPVSDFTKQIVYTKTGELKGWYAIAYAMREKKVISGYGGTRGKMKQTHKSLNPVSLFSHPSRFAVIVYSILIVVLAVVVLLVVFLRHRKTRL
jgi:5'-nucleotidase / UDP-sugar diphosphatase